jgi:TatD DNase family protein
MIDTHSHIDTSIFDEDREAMLNRAWDSGVTSIIIPSIGIDGYANLQKLVDSDERLYRGVGVHPHNVHGLTENDFEIVKSVLNNTRVVAVGEIGLDYYYDFAPKDEQQYWFRKQLHLAKQVNLPVIIHNREADDDILRILQEEQDGTLRGVLHCFSSSTSVLNQAIELGMNVSFTGNITFKKSVLDEVVKSVPDGRFMIETDAPYITPVPHRGKRNEPSFVRYTAERIAELRLSNLNDIITMTTNTARSLFALSLLFLTLNIMLPSLGFAQEDTDDDEEFVHPFPKRFGIGGGLALNTIVESRVITRDGTTTGPVIGNQPFSWDGIQSINGTLMYSLSDKIILEASYIYSKNSRIAYGDIPDPNNPIRYQKNPNVHQFYEVVARYLFNPYSRVTFYAALGPSLIMNNYDAVGFESKLGLTGGLGLFVNIRTPFGLLVPGGEWRINFMLENDLNRQIGLEQSTGRKIFSPEVNVLYSLPRVTLAWFPKL